MITYKTSSYNAVKAFLYSFPVYCTGTVLILLVFKGMPVPGIIAWIALSTIPFLFQKIFKLLFTRKLVLEFDDTGCLIKEYAVKDESFIKQSIVNWAEIKAYKVNFSESKTTHIVLYLKNGAKKRFSFSDEKGQEETTATKSAFSLFFYYIYHYNQGSANNEQIVIRPGFLTTKVGENILYAVIATGIAAIILHIIMAPKTVMFSFISLPILLGLFVKRKKDKDFYAQALQLKPLLQSALND